MSLYCCPLFLLITSLCFFQKAENVRLPNHHIDATEYKNIRKFISKGFVVLDQANGDINSDGLIDKILILRQTAEITAEEKRPVLLLIRQKNNSYLKAFQNDNIILSLGDGGIHGDPYYGITINNGRFSLEHFGGSSWRWTQVITFAYDRNVKDWRLYSLSNSSWHSIGKLELTEERKNSTDFGKLTFAEFKNKWRDN